MTKELAYADGKRLRRQRLYAGAIHGRAINGIASQPFSYVNAIRTASRAVFYRYPAGGGLYLVRDGLLYRGWMRGQHPVRPLP